MWTKICGITRAEDAVCAAQLGVSALGFNFFPGSSRCIEPARAAGIISELHQQPSHELPLCVGLFVNFSLNEVLKTIETSHVNAVQFHGDESLEMLQEFRTARPEFPIIRAFRAGGRECREINASVVEHSHRISNLTVLIDAFVPGAWGGTGVQISSDLYADCTAGCEAPVVLAGGLTPENVASAIAATHPRGVDTAGGVEDRPGIKSRAKMEQFIKAAQVVSG